MTINSNVTIPDTGNKAEQSKVKFIIHEDWITSETQMIKRCDHLGSELVELHRRAMAIIANTELLIEGIEQVAKTVPTYQILAEAEEEKPEFNNIEDLEQEEQESEEELKENETNNRMSSRGL